MKRENGITLIALVITIIVLLILAGVTIVTLTGDNGLLQKLTEAKNNTIEAEGLESIQLAVMASRYNKGINTISLAKNLSQINGLTDTNNQSITEDTVITLPKSVKLNNTKYDIKKDGTVIMNNNSILPDAYEQVEYIESTGTQYIDTGIKGKSELKCFMKLATPNNTSSMDQNVLGCIDSNMFRVYPLTLFQGKWVQGYNDNSTSETGYLSDYTTYQVESYLGKNNQYLKVDGNILLNTNKNYDYTSELNMYLFARNYKNNTANYFFKGKLYYCKILDNDREVKNFIPAKRKSDNKSGLYDTVTGIFYTNQGAGEFRLPLEEYSFSEEYEQVKYIESTGTQYIDTGIKGKSELKCFMKLATPNNTSSMDQNVLGCIDSNMFRVYPLTLFQGKWGQGYNDNSTSETGYLSDYTTYQVESYLGKNNQYLKVDGNILLNTNKNYDYTSELNMYLFARNSKNNTANYFFKGKLYYCKILDNGKEVRNFIPYKCKFDNKPILYDTVEGKIYTNQGTGTFGYETEDGTYVAPTNT